MENERFEVKDDLTAKWAADKIREKKAELAQLKRWYDAQYASAEARTTSEIGYLEGLLFKYFQQVPDAKPKPASRSTNSQAGNLC